MEDGGADEVGPREQAAGLGPHAVGGLVGHRVEEVRLHRPRGVQRLLDPLRREQEELVLQLTGAVALDQRAEVGWEPCGDGLSRGAAA